MKEAKKKRKRRLFIQWTKTDVHMAAYREPKPKCCTNDNCYIKKKWRKQSRLAYIKEPGFKEKQEVNFNSILVTITWKREDNKWLVCDRSNPIRHESFLVNESDLSHYHEGQEIDLGDFRFVMENNYCPSCGDNVSKNTDGDYWCDECEQMTPKKYIEIEWQEVKEPAKFLTTGKLEWETEVTDPKWEQFQKGKREGTILLEEIIIK